MDSVTRQTDSSGQEQSRLYVAFELSLNTWKLAFQTPDRLKARIVNVSARDLSGTLKEFDKTCKRWKLPADVRIVSCYEAGRDGFWIDRWLRSVGIDNRVVDSASIEQSRRRSAKTDRIDAQKLVTQLMRYDGGEKQALSVVRVPCKETEDRRQLHRELKALKKERTAMSNALVNLLICMGIKTAYSHAERMRELLPKLVNAQGEKAPDGLQARLNRMLDRLALVEKQMAQIEQQRQKYLETSQDRPAQMIRQLMSLTGVGLQSAWMFVMEIFSWREIRNGKQLGCLLGLVPMPYNSGNSERDRGGISKTGHPQLRCMAIELAWLWLRYQPESRITEWFKQRFGAGGKRHRRVGIVAVARKMVISWWRYLETGELPPGARIKGEGQKADLAQEAADMGVVIG